MLQKILSLITHRSHVPNCLCANWVSTKSGDELNLWHLPLRDTSLHNRKDVRTLLMICTKRPSTCRCTTKACQRPCPGTRTESRRNSQQLQLWETLSSTLAPENLHDPHTGKSTTLSEECNSGTTVFNCLTKALSFAHQRACRRPTRTALWNPRLLHSLHCAYRLVVVKTTGKQQPCPRTAPVARTTGMSKLSPELTVWTITLVCTITARQHLVGS